jgi:hypothetical protein
MTHRKEATVPIVELQQVEMRPQSPSTLLLHFLLLRSEKEGLLLESHPLFLPFGAVTVETPRNCSIQLTHFLSASHFSIQLQEFIDPDGVGSYEVLEHLTIS